MKQSISFSDQYHVIQRNSDTDIIWNEINKNIWKNAFDFGLQTQYTKYIDQI